MAREMVTDVLVIGGGSAATRAALEAAAAGVAVMLVDKGTVGDSGSSPHALVGFSVPLLDEADSSALFVEDWAKASGGICDRDLVAQCAEHGRFLAEDMEKRGVPFIRNADGSWFISRRAGHSVRRTLQAQGLGKGKHANVIAPMRTGLIDAGVTLQEGTMITRLLLSDGAVIGAYAVGPDGEHFIIRTKAVVLASGGVNRLYTKLCDEVVEHGSRTTGDSYSLAFHAGASLIDMEFVQFRDSPPAGPIYGAAYVNSLGERIMEKYDPENMECAPRYMMARAVYTENFEGRGPVVWHVEDGQVARSRAPVGNYEGGQIVEITLMFQRLMGGARIDVTAATAVPGLYAAGEASGGIHGGDRMQGCGFLETQTFGRIAGQSAAQRAKTTDLPALDPAAVEAEAARLARSTGAQDPVALFERVREIMWAQVGVVSNRTQLTDAIAKFQEIQRIAATDIDQSDLVAAEELRNLALTAELVATAKLAREETRSGHGRTDFPQEDPAWVRHVRLANAGDGAVAVDAIPVVELADA
ncbi:MULTISPECIES: FAD-binding protein [unclassified Sphingobium]|uniref:FAD-binding protein n=1 Tax=unclassified Sphingobium TaxID=2611147 RepID=UPI0022250209|nr:MULTISPECIES: FAD-binding protein [unclassified Sphingobium]MCW2412653.1 fumarate reductase (CoM/CoB) subunit A [Sphingobium sp. B8D3D]MCW2415049.1 fumarate reductase (CoM/CoB) subunit A [Sphingobium sp. B8D3A]